MKIAVMVVTGAMLGLAACGSSTPQPITNPSPPPYVPCPPGYTNYGQYYNPNCIRVLVNNSPTDVVVSPDSNCPPGLIVWQTDPSTGGRRCLTPARVQAQQAYDQAVARLRADVATLPSQDSVQAQINAASLAAADAITVSNAVTALKGTGVTCENYMVAFNHATDVTTAAGTANSTAQASVENLSTRAQTVLDDVTAVRTTGAALRALGGTTPDLSAELGSDTALATSDQAFVNNATSQLKTEDEAVTHAWNQANTLQNEGDCTP